MRGGNSRYPGVTGGHKNLFPRVSSRRGGMKRAIFSPGRGLDARWVGTATKPENLYERMEIHSLVSRDRLRNGFRHRRPNGSCHRFHMVHGRISLTLGRMLPVSAGVLAAVLVFALLPVAGIAQAPPPTPEVLRAGDVVRVQVWRQPELSGEFSITEQGVVAHPLYREVTAAGRPLPEVTEALRIYLGRFETDPNLVVEPLFRVSVGGEVRQPTVHLLRPGTTVAEAVASSGGFSERAAANRVILRRGNADYRIDLTDATSELPGTTIRSGDQILVERERAIFREYVLPVISVAGSIASIYRVFR